MSNDRVRDFSLTAIDRNPVPRTVAFPFSTMLCERCQKNEATVHIRFSNGTVGSDGLPKNPSTDHFCQQCFDEQAQKLISGGEDTAVAKDREKHRRRIAEFNATCRELCQRIGFTVERQKRMVAALEEETPGLFELERPVRVGAD